MIPNKYAASNLIWPIVRRARSYIYSYGVVNLNRNYKNSVLLVGSARSGTTWVSDIINYKNEYRTIFEPFSPSRVKLCRNLRPRQYLSVNNKEKKYILTADAILSGTVRSKWLGINNRKLISSKRLIKDIRANLLLKWLKENFPEVPIVFLIRHPCAVVASRLNLGWNNDHLKEFISQENLMQDFLGPFEDDLRKAKSLFDKLVYQWCIENYVPLKQFKNGQMHLLFYEELCEKPNNTIKELFGYLNKNYDQRVISVMKLPSRLSATHSAVIRNENLIDSWKKYITPAQTDNAIRILSKFGLDHIYGENSPPKIENGNAFLS